MGCIIFTVWGFLKTVVTARCLIAVYFEHPSAAQAWCALKSSLVLCFHRTYIVVGGPTVTNQVKATKSKIIQTMTVAKERERRGRLVGTGGRERENRQAGGEGRQEAQLSLGIQRKVSEEESSSGPQEEVALQRAKDRPLSTRRNGGGQGRRGVYGDAENI